MKDANPPQAWSSTEHSLEDITFPSFPVLFVTCIQVPFPYLLPVQTKFFLVPTPKAKASCFKIEPYSISYCSFKKQFNQVGWPSSISLFVASVSCTAAPFPILGWYVGQIYIFSAVLFCFLHLKTFSPI